MQSEDATRYLISHVSNPILNVSQVVQVVDDEELVANGCKIIRNALFLAEDPVKFDGLSPERILINSLLELLNKR